MTENISWELGVGFENECDSLTSHKDKPAQAQRLEACEVIGHGAAGEPFLGTPLVTRRWKTSGYSLVQS